MATTAAQFSCQIQEGRSRTAGAFYRGEDTSPPTVSVVVPDNSLYHKRHTSTSNRAQSGLAYHVPHAVHLSICHPSSPFSLSVSSGTGTLGVQWRRATGVLARAICSASPRKDRRAAASAARGDVVQKPGRRAADP
ncbi:hypothetical protein DPEC_G00124680 [Dallia pectoralis]|uniref:Uncharacterized protein n=1 Tax=Dallia pectoralis TaxID=75939 RepID=A0ACC2GR52_DALPE|nr:hypothetical protein DPEC_G00124680 [Dallia pectoralis]